MTSHPPTYILTASTSHHWTNQNLEHGVSPFAGHGGLAVDAYTVFTADRRYS